MAAATQYIALSNTGNETLNLSGTGFGISITGTNANSYSQTNQCGTSVAAGASCVITVTFCPAASGALNATLSIIDNAAVSIQTVALSGMGTEPVVSILSPTSLTFADTPVGTAVATQEITLNNTGNGALTLMGISITGANANSYSQTNQCGTSVAAGASCAITVTFAPASSGTLNATLSITDNATGSLQTVALGGTGVVPAVANSSRNVYYIDNTILDIHVASSTPDCTTYNPTTFLCGGGSATAYATIADINVHKLTPNDTVLFRRGGIWREELIDGPNNNGYSGSAGEPITFGAYGDPASPAPIISGANLFTDWTQEQVVNGENTATIYYSPYVTVLGPGSSLHYQPYLFAPMQVFEDGIRLSEIFTDSSSLAAGQWYLDTTNSRIWVRLSGDDRPESHVIEASQRDVGIEVNNHAYITISDLQTEDAITSGIYIDASSCGVLDFSVSSNHIISRVISRNNYYDGITICASADDSVTSSTVAYNGKEGLLLEIPENLVIDGNTVHDNDQLYVSISGPYTTAAGIEVCGNSPNLLVQNNLIYSNGILGTQMRAGGITLDNTGTGSVIRYNKIYSNNKDGIELDADSEDIVYGNIVYDNSNFGIRAFADWQTTITNMQIYNNTAYGNNAGGIMLMGPSGSLKGPCTNNAVINNIAVNSTNGPNLSAQNGCDNRTDQYGNIGSGNVYTFNAFGGASKDFIKWGGNSESTYEAWEALAGNCGGTGCSHSVESDPLFTGVSTNDFALSPYSPAIGAGLNLGEAYEEDLSSVSTWPLEVLLNNQSDSSGGWSIGSYTYY
jgi:hypothetical protein